LTRVCIAYKRLFTSHWAKLCVPRAQRTYVWFEFAWLVCCQRDDDVFFSLELFSTFCANATFLEELKKDKFIQLSKKILIVFKQPAFSSTLTTFQKIIFFMGNLFTFQPRYSACTYAQLEIVWNWSSWSSFGTKSSLEKTNYLCFAKRPYVLHFHFLNLRIFFTPKYFRHISFSQISSRGGKMWIFLWHL
jgi:hypothetical protein